MSHSNVLMSDINKSCFINSKILCYPRQINRTLIKVNFILIIIVIKQVFITKTYLLLNSILKVSF